ncbi:acetylglutamate kinase [Hwanghaeella grinnelliae]|uniref:Acetylglutamate kinase n=1 Tax=Hwanghaeella grinnelliae TaxID=2500179 RepID=A0A437QNI2_9PROT|nr:acetylglutamate kinase [Hwanghaeella grinnelliae]RVU36025.1 acetylglutamate kinase [Hwanghaeella grinnelliae]
MSEDDKDGQAEKDDLAHRLEHKSRRRLEWLAQAGILTEALPYMRRYNDETIVIKYGGHAMGNDELAKLFARDIVLLKQCGINPIVVHGGGPQIGAMLDKMAIKSEFIDGLRVTDGETVGIVEMVLCGQINKGIAAALAEAGGRGVGISGKDGGLIRARKVERTKKDPDSNIERVLDLGFVGEPEKIDPTILDVLRSTDLIPVIAPIGLGPNGETYNINADTVAGAIAAAVNARRLLLLTDVAGVMDKDKHVITDMDVDQASRLMEDGTLTGGMIPKVETCIDAINKGVDGAVILDGRVPHAILLEMFTAHGSGTLIRRR